MSKASLSSISTTSEIGFAGKFTHFVNDPNDPGAAIAFKAYACTGCRRMHLIVGSVSRVPWIKAAMDKKMKQIKDIPAQECYTGVDLAAPGKDFTGVKAWRK